MTVDDKVLEEAIQAVQLAPDTDYIHVGNANDSITSAMATMDPTDFGPKLNEAFHAVGGYLINFDEILVQALHAFGSLEHMLWIAPPGRAKSFGAEMLFSLFNNADTLALQITKDMQRSAIFGQTIPKELIEKGEEITNLSGGLADSHFAFLDELMDGSDWTLRAILNIINERVFRSKSMGEIKAPLHSVIATTNFFRQTDSLEAVIDRFLARAYVNEAQTMGQRMDITDVYLKHGGKITLPHLEYADLLAFAEWIESPDGVDVPESVKLMHSILLEDYKMEIYQHTLQQWAAKRGDFDLTDPDNAAQVPDARALRVDITPRTGVKALDFVRVAAGVDGRQTLNWSDLRSAGLAYTVVGDGSGSGEVWNAVCDSYLLNLSEKDFEELEKIAELIRLARRLQKERNDNTSFTFTLFGKSEMVTKQNIRMVSQKLTRRGHPAIKKAMEYLDADIDAITSSTQATGIVIPGW